jgi:hypothetical protein
MFHVDDLHASLRLQLNNAKDFMEPDEDENGDGLELVRKAELSLLLLLADFVMLN